MRSRWVDILIVLLLVLLTINTELDHRIISKLEKRLETLERVVALEVK